MDTDEQIKEDFNDFEEFLKKYCKKHKITPEEALKHAQVKVTHDYYFIDRHK